VGSEPALHASANSYNLGQIDRLRGNVTDEAWKEYIKSQKPPEPDDDFTVV